MNLPITTAVLQSQQLPTQPIGGQETFNPRRATDMPDMPLFHLRAADSRGFSNDSLQLSHGVVQPIPMPSGPSIAAAGPTAAESIGGAVEARAPDTDTGDARARSELEEMVEKAWQKIMRKLDIERERRGFAKWI